MANKDKKAAKTAAAKAILAEKKVVKPTVPVTEVKTPVEITVVEIPAVESPIVVEPAVKEEVPTPAVVTPQVETPIEVLESEIKKPIPIKKRDIKKIEVKNSIVTLPFPKAVNIPRIKAEEVPVEKDEATVAPMYDRLTTAIKGDRFTHADALKLGEMFKTEFCDDPNATKEQQIFGKMQVKGLLLNEMLFYSAQVANDYQTLGVKVTSEMFVAIEAQAREMYGITLKGLPIAGHPDQLMIDFPKSDIPKEVQTAIIADKKALTEKVEIPEPTVDMPEAEKLTVLRAIMSQKNGMGINLINSINWATKAYDLPGDNPAMIIALLFDKFKNDDPILLKGLTNAVIGKFSTEHTASSVHSLIKIWAKIFPDKAIANLVKVFISRATEKRINEYNLRVEPDKKLSIENEFAIINRRIKMSITDDVVKGILEKNATTPTKDESGKNEIFIDGDKCFKSLVGAYGDSPSIIAAKLAEIVKYYAKPVGRLDSYKDKSTYAD